MKINVSSEPSTYILQHNWIGGKLHMNYHSRFDKAHLDDCDVCWDEYNEFVQDQEWEGAEE